MLLIEEAGDIGQNVKENSAAKKITLNMTSSGLCAMVAAQVMKVEML